MKLKDIKPNESNPRIIKDEKFKKLVNSIREFPAMMELRPMVVDAQNVVLGGNMRLKALQELGYSEIPDTWVKRASDLTDEEKQRFIIADNVGFGEWDWQALANEWDADKLNEWGLDAPDSFDVQVETQEDDFSVPNEVHTDIVIGDMFQIGRHRLICGDSMDSDVLFRLMGEQKASTVFTDPPYDLSDEGYAENIYLFTEDAHVFVMHDDCGIIEYLRRSQLNFKRFFVADFTFSSPRGNDPYLRHILVSHETNGKAIAHQNMHDGFSSIIKMEYRGNLKEEKHHDHQKSIEFVSKFIQHYSKDNSLVLDLFLGSGTTMITCEQLNRTCYGVELNPKFCQVVIDRFKKYNPDIFIKKIE